MYAEVPAEFARNDFADGSEEPRADAASSELEFAVAVTDALVEASRAWAERAERASLAFRARSSVLDSFALLYAFLFAVS